MLSATFPLVLHKNSPWNRNTHIGFSDDESKKHSWGGVIRNVHRGGQLGTLHKLKIYKNTASLFSVTSALILQIEGGSRVEIQNCRVKPPQFLLVSTSSVQTSVLGQSSGIHSWPSRRWLSHRVFTSMFTYSCSILLSLVRVLLLTNQGHWGTKDIFTYAKTEKQSETKLLCIFHGKLLENVLL